MSKISNITQMVMRSILFTPFETSGNRIYCTRKYASKAQEKLRTVDDKDVEHHSSYSNDWWNINGTMEPLHRFNPLRIKFIRDGLANVGHKEINHNMPLQGLKILDVGCGGGILSEPLARIGGNVTGIDASEELIKTAKEHSLLDKSLSGRLNYINISMEDLSKEKPNEYDAIVASEILEHVNNQELFLKSCVDVLKPGGSLFITTINRTFLSLVGAIFAVEYVFRILPRGSHNHDKFISPAETQNILEKYGCQAKLLHGILYNPITKKWSWIKSTDILYGLHVTKNSGPASKS